MSVASVTTAHPVTTTDSVTTAPDSRTADYGPAGMSRSGNMTLRARIARAWVAAWMVVMSASGRRDRVATIPAIDSAYSQQENWRRKYPAVDRVQRRDLFIARFRGVDFGVVLLPHCELVTVETRLVTFVQTAAQVGVVVPVDGS